jgi:hypothetical protein
MPPEWRRFRRIRRPFLDVLVFEETERGPTDDMALQFKAVAQAGNFAFSSGRSSS